MRENPNPVVKMVDVAREAGVHQTTVSRALRGDPALPQATRTRLQELAKSMGYRRNPLVSALISERRRGKPTGRGAALSILSSGGQPERWRRSVSYAAIYRHMKASAEKLGYRLEEHAIDHADMRIERLQKILLARGVRGLVISPMLPASGIVELDFSEFAVVALRLGSKEPSVNRVAPDYFAIASAALDKLWDTGHRKIAFFSQARVDEQVCHRSLAAYLAKRYARIKNFLKPILLENWSFDDFQDWYFKHKPDAIIASVYEDYRSIEHWLRELSVSVPAALSVINLDCHAQTNEAGYIHDHELEASSAIDLLVSKVESADFGIPKSPIRLSVPGIWRDGDLFSPRK